MPVRFARLAQVRANATSFRLKPANCLPLSSVCLVFFLLALTAVPAAQDVSSSTFNDISTLPRALGFEAQGTGDAPSGWTVSPAGTVFADRESVHGGTWAARLERHADSPGAFTTMQRSVPLDFAGHTIEFRGYLRLDQVDGFTGLWMREDGEGKSLAFDNMQARGLKGTAGWQQYSITLPLHEDARQLFFGVLLSGSGKVWVDDLELLVDGKPGWTAPKAHRPTTVLERDTRFDSGSGLVLTSLTPVQIENLATLGRVWGFLKYHHPLVAAGKFHWDYELLAIMPKVLRAGDRSAANATMLGWIREMGTVPPCTTCAKLDESELQLRPDLAWIGDKNLLGPGLSAELGSIYRNRGTSQFYLSLSPGVNNPAFQHELAYQRIKLPDAGFQLLGLYRFWNVVQYWSPYRDLLGDSWGRVLPEFVPRIALAKSPEEYQRELMALIARMRDGHANLWSSLKVRPPAGECRLPVTVRFVETRPVVTALLGDAGRNSGFAVGDVVAEIDGTPVARLVEQWTPYYAASNDAARLRDIAASMTRGACGDAAVKVLRLAQVTGREGVVELKPGRVSASQQQNPSWHDLPGDTFRMLSPEVAYLKLSSVKSADAADYVKSASRAQGLIIDIRNYPSSFMVFALGSLLVPAETEFARFTRSELANPGSFHWTEPISIKPATPHFSGKVVILVDEVSQSQAEYTSMAFRSVPGAVVVGSTTAGADGNVSAFALPGGFSTMISGIGVFYPNRKPTQQIGIVPDVVVTPTMAGIRSGRDEVLESGLRQILGSKTSADEIEKMARPGTP